jgi:hypothetical protein
MDILSKKEKKGHEGMTELLFRLLDSPFFDEWLAVV